MTLLKAVVNQVLVWCIWGAAENYGVRALLEVAYSLPKPIRLQRPPPKSVATFSHWHAARIIIAILYLAYSVIRCQITMPTGLYHILKLSPYASESNIKHQYRNFAKIYHPDKAGYEHEGVFLQLQQAYSVLSDPVLRFAYDRYVEDLPSFGNDISSWERLSSTRDFMLQGLEIVAMLQLQLFVMQLLAWLVRRSKSNAVGAGTYVCGLSDSVGLSSSSRDGRPPGAAHPG